MPIQSCPKIASDISGTWVGQFLAGNPFQNVVKDVGNPLALSTPTQDWETQNFQDIRIYKIGATYYAFYTCASQAGWSSGLQIGVATASEAEYPYTWHKLAGNPVLTFGTQSTVDDDALGNCNLIPMPDGSFRLYYRGRAQIGGIWYERPCLATCSAAEFPGTWHKYAGNPIMTVTPGTWDAELIHPEIIIPPWEGPDTNWHMVYAGYGADAHWRGGHATSPDGIAWTREASNPVLPLGPAGAWDAVHRHPVGQVVKLGSAWAILYQGFDGSYWQIGVVGTPDFVNFTVLPNPILSRTVAAWDAFGIEDPAVVYHPTTKSVDLIYVAWLGTSYNYKWGLATGHR